VYYLLKLEINSLQCEKDFLFTLLDDIDALILERREDKGDELPTASYKRSNQVNEKIHTKKMNLHKDKREKQEKQEKQEKREKQKNNTAIEEVRLFLL